MKKKYLSVTQDRLGNAHFPKSKILIWNARSRSAYKEQGGSNQAMFDSYIKREGKNRYQLLRINLTMLAFQLKNIDLECKIALGL